MARKTSILKKLGRLCRYIAASLVLAAGIYYLFQPPRTTIGFFDASWPPMAWGAIMIVGGAIVGAGLFTRIMQVEQYGMMMFGVGAGMLATSQTLVMFAPPITHTRGGGTLVLWALVAFSAARYFELSAEIRSGRIAEQRLKEVG